MKGNVTAILSMLHEPAGLNSATRRFRQQPVLAWTLQRLAMAENLGSIAIICWEDQVQEVAPIAAERETYVLAKDPRMTLPSVEAVTASRRWSDGWRGGLFFACDFDLGFHGPWVQEVIQRLTSDAVILVDPSAGLVDPKIIDDVIAHANERASLELCFTQAAPGLAGALLRPALVERLAGAKTHPGRLLSYLPDQPMRDPIGGDGCVPVPASIARTTRNFRLDSDRQVQRLSDASIHLNGQLVASDAEDLVNRLRWTAEIDSMPREVVLELNTDRLSAPIFWPGKSQRIERPPMTLDMAKRIFEQLAAADDIRLTLAGVGDPLLCPDFFEILAAARACGIQAVHVETDLLSDAAVIEKLAAAPVDLVSMNLPAMSAAVYAAVMGVDRYVDAVESIKHFITTRQKRNRSTPLLVPTFVKCKANMAEMEAWYDQWLKALGAAVIIGPSDFSGLVPDCGVADMSPPRRIACGRLWSRMSILSDGKVASCEQDVLGRQIVGDVSSQSITEIWQQGMTELRRSHQCGQWTASPHCAGCREWHRP